MTPQWHVWQPRYELRLVRGDGGAPPILVWSRHRMRAVAAYCQALEERERDLGQARLVVFDRWRGIVVESRSGADPGRS